MALVLVGTENAFPSFHLGFGIFWGVQNQNTVITCISVHVNTLYFILYMYLVDQINSNFTFCDFFFYIKYKYASDRIFDQNGSDTLNVK